MAQLNEVVTTVDYITLVVNGPQHGVTAVTGTVLPLTAVTNRVANKVLEIGTPGAQGQKGSPTNAVLRNVNTFAIRGLIATAIDQTDLSNYIPPFFVSLGANETATVVKCKYVIGVGTSATCKLTNNGVDIPGFTNMVVTQTPGITAPGGAAVVEDDQIALVITDTAGGPANLSLTVIFEYTVR